MTKKFELLASDQKNILNEMDAARGQLDERIKSLEAQANTSPDMVKNEISYIYSYLRELDNNYYKLSTKIYEAQSEVFDYVFKYRQEHQQGHLPPIKSATMMEKVIKDLGLEKEYEYIKPVYMMAKKNTAIIG